MSYKAGTTVFGTFISKDLSCMSTNEFLPALDGGLNLNWETFELIRLYWNVISCKMLSTLRLILTVSEISDGGVLSVS